MADASSNNVGTAVEDAIVAKVQEQMTQKLANLRCPQHDQVPKLTIEGNSLKSLKKPYFSGVEEAAFASSDVLPGSAGS